MASNSPITTSLSVSFSKDSQSNNVFQLEEYQPKARIDGTLPALKDPQYRYAAVYGNHLKNGSANVYTLDGHNCIARFIDPATVSNKLEANATKDDEQIIVFSGEDAYDVGVAGLTQVFEVEQIGKFYQIQGSNVIETPVTLAYDGVNQRITATPKGKWYGVVRIKYRSQGHLYLVTLDLNRPVGEKMILVGSSFYWNTDTLEYLPVIAYLEFTDEASTKDIKNGIELEEYSPSEDSPYYPLVSPTVKLVDLYIDRPPYTMEGSTGVVFELASLNAGKFSYTDTSIVSFNDAESFSGGSTGSVGAAFVPLMLFDSSYNRIPNGSVQFNWDSDSSTFIPKPSGTYTGVGVVSTSRIGFRYRVDITNTPVLAFKDKEGKSTVKRLAVLTARNTFTNPETKEVLHGFAEIQLDASDASASSEGDNLLQVETVGKDDLRANRVTINYDQQLVMVYADHPYEYFIRGGGSISRVGSSSIEETQYTELTFNGESSSEFKQAGLVESSVMLDVVIMLTKDGATASVEAVYDPKSRKINLNPKGEYYGVVEVAYRRHGDLYKATLAPYDLNKDGFTDGFQSWFIAYSIWKDPATQISYPTFVSTKLSTTADPQFELNNQISIAKFEKALGKQDAPMSRREQYYKIRAAFGSTITPVNCSVGIPYEQRMTERTMVAVTGSNSISVGPGLENFELEAISAIMNERGESSNYSGGVYDPSTQQIYLGTDDQKIYGLFFLKATYSEKIVRVTLPEEIEEVRDRSYVASPDHIGALVVHDTQFNPVTGAPAIAYAYTEVVNERDEMESDGDKPGNEKFSDNFKYVIEEDAEIEPVINDNIKTICYFLKVFPCPEGSLEQGFAGGDGSSQILLTGDSNFSMGMTYRFLPSEQKFSFEPGVPYKSILKVEKSAFLNNSSKVSLQYPPTDQIFANIPNGSKMLDVFGVDWTEKVVLRLPGDKYKSLNWRKVLHQGSGVRGYMVPEMGGLNATYNTVGPYEIVACVQFDTELLGTFYAEIPLIGTIEYRYWTNYGKIAAFWDASTAPGHSTEISSYYGTDKVLNILGKWTWHGKEYLASGSYNISKKAPTQKTTKAPVQKVNKPESQQ